LILLAAPAALPEANNVNGLSGLPLTWRWKLQTAAGLALTPSMHWPTPVISHEVEHDQGPVLVTFEYQIDPANRE